MAAVVGDQVLARYPNCRAGVRQARLACVLAANASLYEVTLDRIFAAPAQADTLAQGTFEFISGRATDLADQIEAWLAEQRTAVQMTVAIKKYGYGARGLATDPVLWLHKAGGERMEYDPGNRPAFLEIDRWLEQAGYVPVAPESGYKHIEVHPDMIVRRYSREVVR